MVKLYITIRSLLSSQYDMSTLLSLYFRMCEHTRDNGPSLSKIVLVEVTQVFQISLFLSKW